MYLDVIRTGRKDPGEINARAAEKTAETVAIAKLFGADYFDGDRKYGYGGYTYDGRWQQVAADLVEHYGLDSGSRVLDVGCAKGFLVTDLTQYVWLACGVDASRYAVAEAPHPDAVGLLHLASAHDLPFPDKSFDLVVSINTLHNLPYPRLIQALREMARVSRGSMFVQVDAYRDGYERALFENWVLTAETHGTPEFWLGVFAEAGYRGDYGWTII